MVECQVCDQEMRNLSYTYNYCDQKFCVNHRLPEKHDCVGLLQFDEKVQWFDDSTEQIQSKRKAIESSDHGPNKSYETVELGALPGKTREPDYATSPDVNPDGSVAGSNKTDTRGIEESTNQKSQLMIVLLISVLIAAVLWFWMF